jgi:hypothetical protein
MAAPVVVTIGTGTVTVGYPFSTYWQDGRSQYMITAAEIIAAGGSAGNIGNLQFNVSTFNASLQTMSGYNIRMQNTTATSLTGFVGTGWTTVYTGTELITANGWKDKVFQSPFMWDGTSNLLIEVCFDNTSYTSYSYVYATAGAAGMEYHRYTDGATGCALTAPSTSVNRPNMKFTITPLSYTIVSGTVTNANTGLPINGAKIMCGDSVAYSIANGTYTMNVLPGNKVFECSKAGFDALSATATVAGMNFTQNFALLENTAKPGAVLAALNTAQTAVNINWGLPMSSYEIIYDDGVAENYTSWNVAGNINALKFTPLNQYPVHIEGGSVYVGDGSYPSGANLQGFSMGVYDDDGALGYPSTELGTVEVSPSAYGWVDFTFATPITITSGNFYLGMIQGGNYPNCLAIGVDETNPSMRSYSKNVTNNAPWVPAGYNDFMIRAIVHGSGGPLDLATGNAPVFIEKTRINAATKFLKQPKPAKGLEGDALYKPMGNGDAPESLLGYQVWRLKQGEELTPAVWTSVSTPTGTSTVDNSWPTLPNGPYLWAVKAKYTGNRWSEAVFSNVLGKGWKSNVTFNITLSSPTAVPLGVNISMVSTTTDSTYAAMTPATGTVNFPHVWKGNYNITVAKFGYETYTANVDILNDSYVFNILLMEMTYAPYNLFVDDRTLVAIWNAPNPQIALFEERWNGGFGANAWVVNGGNWSIAAGLGSPAPSAQFNWTPQVTNYEQTITSKDIVGQGSPALRLKYDLYLDNFGTTNENQMAVEIWDGAAWNRLANYSNLGGSFSWTTYAHNITAYTWDTFKIRFVAYGTDSYDINNWNLDNILVIAAIADDKSRLGFDVYLDDIQIGFTTDTTYQIPQNLCVYGQTYTASVDAVYESGVSDRDYYTFTAHYLPPPTNLQGMAIQDAAYLTWEAPVMPGKKMSINKALATSFPISNEADANAIATTPNATDAVFDLQYSYDAAAASGAAGNAGAESDGTFLYSTRWGSNLIHKYNLDGTLAEEFSIPGVTGLRDLAYDGQYFYGGAAATTIFKMDFTTKTLVGTITSPTAVRAIAYDEDEVGFWVNNWATNLTLVSPTGATLNTLATPPPSMYGSAFDNWTTGGPFLWVFSGTSSGGGCQVEQLSLTTGTVTGVMHSVSADLGASIAGGLFTQPGIVSGFVTLGGLAQGDGAADQLFGYELAAGGGGGGGTTPSTLMGYNLYRNGSWVAYIEKPALEYYDLYLNPANYCYDITAVYDLVPYGFPAGSTDESLEEGPACVDINYGAPIPWTEDWQTAAFTYNNWSFAPSQGHWRISNMTGNQVPAVEFNWAAPEADYSYALESQALNAAIYDCSDIWLDFDLKLDDRNMTGEELLTVEVFWNGNWHEVAEYANEGSFDWDTKHIEINSTAGKALKLRFTAHGANTADILGWFIDNITVYPVAHPAANLLGDALYPANGNVDIKLDWNSPECASVGGGSVVDYIFDDGTAENGWAINPGYDAWMGNQFPVTDAGSLISFDIYFMANASATVTQGTIDIFDGGYNLIGTSDAFAIPTDAWATVNVSSTVNFNGTFYAMFHWANFSGNTNWAGVDENGPFVPQNYAMYYDGTAWSTLSAATGGANCVFLLRAKALVGKDLKQVVLGPTVSSAPRTPVTGVLSAANRSVNTGNYATTNVTIMDNSRGAVGYNVYRDGVLLNTTLVTDTTYTDANIATFANCYVVKAVHEGYFGDFESVETNEVCLDVTGINKPATQTLSVFPNPARDYVNVKTTKDIRKIEMLNYLGQSVYTQTVEGEATFTISTVTFESGVYFIRFTDKAGTVTNERVTITE